MTISPRSYIYMTGCLSQVVGIPLFRKAIKRAVKVGQVVGHLVRHTQTTHRIPVCLNEYLHGSFHLRKGCGHIELTAPVRFPCHIALMAALLGTVNTRLYRN